MQIDAVGTTLTAADGSFNFMIAEGCSGIRSITAMAMITAIYVHLTQDRFWKKAHHLRLFDRLCHCRQYRTNLYGVVLVAKFINPELGCGNLPRLLG